MLLKILNVAFLFKPSCGDGCIISVFRGGSSDHVIDGVAIDDVPHFSI